MKKIKLMILVGVLLLPIGVQAQEMFHNYDYTFDRDTFNYDITVENDVNMLSVCSKEHADANRNKLCFYSEDLSVTNLTLLNYNLQSVFYVLNDTIVDGTFHVPYGRLKNEYNLSDNFLTTYIYLKMVRPIDFDIIEKKEEVDGKRIIEGYYDDIFVKVEEDPENQNCHVYNKNGDLIMKWDFITKNVDGEENSVSIVYLYDKYGNVFSYMDSSKEYYIEYYDFGELKEGNNEFNYLVFDVNGNYNIMHKINIYRKPAVATQSEENIKSSPKTGSFTNLVVSSLLVLSLIVLLIFNRKYNKEG